MFYAYVLLSHKDKRFYTGCTADLRNRFKEHKQGKVFSTKGRLPLELIYYEACLDKNDSIQRESYLKSGRGKYYLKRRLKRFLFRTGFGPLEGNP